MSEEKKQIKLFLKTKDYKAVAKAHSEWSLKWHENEWKEFIQIIRDDTLQEVEGKLFSLTSFVIVDGKAKHPGEAEDPITYAKNQVLKQALSTIKEMRKND